MVKYKKRGKPTKSPPKAIFEWQYYDLNMSAQELAKEYNVAEQTIYNWATKFRKEQDKK